MPHNRFDWASRIKAAEREYHAVRVAVDWLLGATPNEIHDVTEERGWDDLAVADIYAVDRNLDATYLIRMFSLFERAIFSYWRLLTGNHVRDAEGDVRASRIRAPTRGRHRPEVGHCEELFPAWATTRTSSSAAPNKGFFLSRL